MGVDLSQFHQVFIEESFEGLDVMESALMELDPDSIENETINAIFRAAHSIKGGSATFGFTAIADFTHVLETLLDQVRAGQRELNATDVNLFLQSVDCMREMLQLLQNNDNSATPLSDELKGKFEKLLDSGEVVAEKQDSASGKSSSESDWSIHFIPGQGILKSGNDPLRIFNSLDDIADLSVRASTKNVPKLSELDPEELFLEWHLIIGGCTNREEIAEQFEWVVDDSVVDIAVFDVDSKVGCSRKTVRFLPKSEIFQSGNDPVGLLRAIEELDQNAEIQPSLSKVPSIKLLDPEQCFIHWSISLSPLVDDEKIYEVFEWVEDEAKIEIHLDQASTELSPPVEVRPSNEAEQSRDMTKPSASEPATAKPKKDAPPGKKNTSSETSSIRVGIDKIDNLINMVGELVITQSMLGQLGTEFDLNKTPKLLEGLNQLEQNTRELQESVMRIRMLPISFAFSRFPRMVRDLGQQLGKKIQLEMQGEQTELDKTVMEKIGDPLVHLVRNAIDHGIESAAHRRAAGKIETGKITLNAYHQGGNVVIEIADDGKGLDRDVILGKAIEKGLISDIEGNNLTDEQVFDLIFQPGFSTAHQVSDISGRGVGMDVVKRNIQSLNGVVEIQSKKGEGSRIRIRLPLTLAILDGQLVRVGANIYIFPLVSIVESMQCRPELINHIAGNHSVFRLRDDYVPIVPLNKVFSTDAGYEDLDQALMVVVESDGDKVGIVVDELLAQQQVVIKSLEQNYRRIEGVSGATILGDGTVALIVDIPGVVKLAGADSTRSLLNSEGVTPVNQQALRKQA